MSTIRTVDLELLRHGPAHNQLLSPLTRYLGLCGNHAPATVTVPFEHEHLFGRLATLRYQDSEQTRQIQLKEMAHQMSEILATIPGLIAEFCEPPTTETQLTHLQLVLSASELALLPFELATSPSAFPGAGQPLALQRQMPLCITRHVRRAGSTAFSWPRQPRILFITASPPGAGTVPLEAHLQVLREVVDPWVSYYNPDDRADRRDKLEPHLKLLPNASITAIEELCSRESFTHVHILAHGVPIGDGAYEGFGIALHDSHQSSKIEKVSGGRLATALRTFQRRSGGMSAPAVVTLATCDSGNVGSVVGAGSSIAHALHAAGIPLVVAAQFPLTFEGSVVMVETLYRRLLEGDDPRSVLADLRQALWTRLSGNHDWAAMVAYAALPPDLGDQLHDVRLLQANRSIAAATDRCQNLVRLAKELEISIQADSRAEFHGLTTEQQEKIDGAIRQLQQGQERLLWLLGQRKRQGRWIDASKLFGLLGYAKEREAQLHFQLSHLLPGGPEGSADSVVTIPPWRQARLRSQACLAAARDHYYEGFKADHSSYQNLVRYLTLVVITQVDEPSFANLIGFCETLARLDIEHEDRQHEVNAHAALAELTVLAMAGGDPAQQDEQQLEQIKARARVHALEVIRLAGRDAPLSRALSQRVRYYLDWFHFVYGKVDNAAIEAIVLTAEAMQAELVRGRELADES